MELGFPIRSLNFTDLSQDSTKDLVGTLCLPVSPWVIGCAFSVNHHEGAKQLCDDLVNEMSALVSHYLNRATKSCDDVLVDKFSGATSIGLPNCFSFGPLGHVVSGYNDVSGMASSSSRLDRAYIVQAPLLKGRLW